MNSTNNMKTIDTISGFGYVDTSRNALIISQTEELKAALALSELHKRTDINGILVKQDSPGMAYLIVYETSVKDTCEGKLPYREAEDAFIFGSGCLYTDPSWRRYRDMGCGLIPCTTWEEFEKLMNEHEDGINAVFAVEYDAGALQVLDCKEAGEADNGTILIEPDQVKQCRMIMAMEWA